jgi:D-alanyl-D-alanine carboxypeptidase
MHSANDIAYMIAENVSKTVPDFASRMNAKAKEFGLQNTHFVTPNGLHNANHYSTAYDMSIITKHAFKIPWIRKTINTKTKTIKTSKGVTLPLKNTNKLLGKDGCIGGKTGYTVPAGRCLVTVYERSGRKILGVVMDSVYDPLDSYVFNDMKRIIDWSYKEKPSILIKKGSIVSNKTLKYKPLGFGPSVKLKVPIRISQDVKYYNNSINNSEIKETTSIYNVDTSKLKGNTPIGKLNVKQRNYSKDYYLYSDISSKVIFEKSLPFYIAVLAVIAIVAYFIRRKVKAFLNV